MKNKFLCVHGHFYQPPRENPWLDAIEPQDSAHPYRDWNERIYHECYGPNSACPLADAEGRIFDLSDNYRKMSFNFGASLLSWLAREKPRLYGRVLEADRESERERGHGNAIAQPWVHAILPLQNLRDKRTLVRWGLDDFRLRFGREAEGIWLPETGVDEETLETLIESGLRFTILAPSQAARARELGAGQGGWRAVTADTLNPTRPYRWLSRAQPGKWIALFFFHEGLHQAVVDGSAFKEPHTLFSKVDARFLPDDSTQLVHLATDGEFYGHHHRAGAERLAATFRLAEAAGLQVVNYAQFLDAFPPPEEIDIRPRTAWSCEHGLGRWTQHCGCGSAHLKKWRQDWRRPLRAALDWLAAELDAVYEARAGHYLRDYWSARDEYAQRLVDPSPANAEAFLKRHQFAHLAEHEKVEALKLLEMQRQRLAMFTSCGWFFDDISGIETAQCLQHAARAVELAAGFGAELSAGLRERLFLCKSNLSQSKDGARVYERFAESRKTGLDRAAAHLALVAHLAPGLPVDATPGFERSVGEPELAESQGLAGRDRKYSRRTVSVRRLSTLERLDAAAAVHQRDRMDLLCRLGPPEAGEGLAGRFSTRDERAFDALLAEKFAPETYTLEAMFAADRAEAARLLAPRPGAEHSRRLFMEGWVRALARLSSEKYADWDEALSMLGECRAQHLRPDGLPWVGALRARLTALVEGLVRDPQAARLSAVGRWLGGFERAKMTVELWELRRAFWDWRQRLVADGGSQAEKELAAAFGEKLGFSPLAVWGAGRPAPEGAPR